MSAKKVTAPTPMICAATAIFSLQVVIFTLLFSENAFAYSCGLQYVSTVLSRHEYIGVGATIVAEPRFRGIARPLTR